MQSKQVAVAGILTGAVMTGLGSVVLVAGLARAEQPDRDPVIGYQDVEETYPGVDPLPPPTAKLSEEPSQGPSSRPRGAAADRHGADHEPGDPGSTAASDPGRPRAPHEPAGPGSTAGSTPTSGPTGMPEPEPTTESTGPAEPTMEPTPTQTPTPSEEPQSPSLARAGG